MVSERSLGSLLLALLAIALLAVSLTMPWWDYQHSTPRRTPAGGFNDPGEDGVVATSWTAEPGEGDGTAQPEDPAATQRALDLIQWAIIAAIGALAVGALGDLRWLDRVVRRPVTLLLHVAAFAACGVALAWAWFVLPDAFGHGVNEAYSSFLGDDGQYTQSQILLGWAVAAVAAAPIFGAFLMKFQAGAPDPTVVVDLYLQGEI